MEAIIEKVREHEFLYDVNSPHYRNFNMRQQAWQQIAEELNTTAESVKASWDNLRRCFLNALGRRAKRGGKKGPRWKYHLQMSFLIPFIDFRKTLNNNSSALPNNNYSATDSSDAENADEKSVAVYVKKSEPKETLGLADEAVADSPSVKKAKRARSDVSVKEMSASGKEIAIAKKPKLNESTQDSSPRDTDADDTDAFFASMAKMTKTLPLVEQLKIKKLLSDVVLTAQIKMAEAASHLANSVP